MDYFIVFLLVIIIFTFISDKKVISINLLNGKIKNINNEIDKIYDETLIIHIDDEIIKDKNMLVESINNKIASDITKNYVMLLLKNTSLNDNDIKILIANYINVNKKPCGFRPMYQYKYMANRKIKNIIKELKEATINYINIFSKSDIDSYAVIILMKDEIDEINYIFSKNNEKKIISFSPCENVKVMCNSAKGNLLSEIEEMHNLDFKAIVKSGILILSGITITANIISAIYNLEVVNIIVSFIIYWCYNFVIKYMYKPIGKYKFVSSYLFPVFLIIYLMIVIINSIKIRKDKKKDKQKENKKVHAS